MILVYNVKYTERRTYIFDYGREQIYKSIIYFTYTFVFLNLI